MYATSAITFTPALNTPTPHMLSNSGCNFKYELLNIYAPTLQH